MQAGELHASTAVTQASAIATIGGGHTAPADGGSPHSRGCGVASGGIEGADGEELRGGDGKVLGVKHAVAFLANGLLKSEFTAGTLSRVQYKQIVREAAAQFAVSHSDLRLGKAFQEEVARCFCSKRQYVIQRACWTSDGLTLKYAMRYLLGPTNTQSPLQLVFLRVVEAQLVKEQRARDIVDAHVRLRKPVWLRKLRDRLGRWNEHAAREEVRQMRECIEVRKRAWLQGHVTGRDCACPITLEAREGRTLVNNSMMSEFLRRLHAWWRLHEDDDAEDDPNEEEGNGNPPGPKWTWREE